MFAPLIAIALGQGAGPDVPTTEFLTWPGWRYLGGAASAPAQAYAAPFDFSALPKPAETAATWKVKVFVLTDVLRLGPDAQGVLRSDRDGMAENYLAETQGALGRFGLLLGPGVKVSPDVTLEEELVSAPYRVNAIDEDFLRNYVGARVNGGGYDAEDKVYRGPYHSIICLVPSTLEPKGVRTEVYGMPVTCLSIEDPAGHLELGELETRLAEVVWWDMKARAIARLDTSPKLPISADEATKLASFDSVSSADLYRRFAKPGEEAGSEPGLPEVPGLAQAWRTPRASAEIADDSVKGKVVKISFKGPTKSMGLALPKRSDGQPLANLEDGKTLSLTLKTATRDDIAVRLDDKDGRHAWIALGTHPQVPGSAEYPVIQSQIAAQNEWETVRLDVAAAAKKGSLSEISQIAFEFTPGARDTGREMLDPIEISLSDVSFVSEPATTVTSAADPAETRALIAAKATETSGDLRSMLTSPIALDRLNGASLYTKVKDPMAESQLAVLALAPDPAIAEVALRALDFQDTETARAGIRRAIRAAITPVGRGLAANLLAAKGEPNIAGDCASLLAHRTWHGRLAGVQALAKLPGREAAIVRLAFLAQENPEIKLAVIRNIDPKDEAQVRRLLWAEVNEPLDLVRAESAIKLLQSPVAELKTEGYKAVRDESATVRSLVLAYMAANPDEAHRDALRVAVADRNGPVRAAAIRGFAALEKGAAPEELASVLEDEHPDVQAALAEYGGRHPLPAAAIKRLKDSKLPNVAEIAARIKE